MDVRVKVNFSKYLGLELCKRHKKVMKKYCFFVNNDLDGRGFAGLADAP
jgi:hypothetical protein